MNITKKLQQYLNFTNAQQYHDAGYDGRGIKILTSEPKADEHLYDILTTGTAWDPGSIVGISHKTGMLIDQLAEEAIDGGYHIVTMSWSADYYYGGTLYAKAKAAFKKMLDAGIYVVTSSGNRGADSIKSSNKYDSRLIVVGAVEMDLGLAVYSSYESDDDIVDCCGLVNLDIYDDPRGYLGKYFAGTSEACRAVAGIISCILSRDPEADIYLIIEESCLDLGEDGYDNKYGHGLLVLPEINGLNLSAPMRKPNGHIVNVHKDWVDQKLAEGYTPYWES